MTNSKKTGVVKLYNVEAGFGYVHVENEELRLTAAAANSFVDQIVAKAFLTMEVAPGPGGKNVIVAVTAVEPPLVRKAAEPKKLIKLSQPGERSLWAAVKQFDPAKGGFAYLSGDLIRETAFLPKALFKDKQDLPKDTPLWVSVVMAEKGWRVVRCEFGPKIEVEFHNYMANQLKLLAEQQAAEATAAEPAAVAHEPSSEPVVSESSAVAEKPLRQKSNRITKKGGKDMSQLTRGPKRRAVEAPVDPVRLLPVSGEALIGKVLEHSGLIEKKIASETGNPAMAAALMAAMPKHQETVH